MSSVVLRPAQRFPVGQSVGAYPATAWGPVAPPAGAPGGAALETAVVQADGTLTFTTLAEDTTFFAYALVGGEHRIVRFSNSATRVRRVLDTPSLVSYWRLGEKNGSTATDEKSTNHGTYAGGVDLGTRGRRGGLRAARFNGLSGRCSLPASLGDFAAAAVSLDGWIRTDDPTKIDQQILGAYLNAAPFNGWGVMYNLSSSRKIGYFSSVLGSWVESTGTIADIGWHHIAVTVTAGGAVSFYLDGAAAGTGVSAAPGAYVGNKMIGAVQDGLINFFKGAIEGLAVYNAVLAPADVASLARAR